MKKIFFIICITILFVGEIFGQAQVDIPFDVTDGNDTVAVAVGLDLTATNCIDPQLGEYDIPPIPPQFDVRFDLNPYGCGPVSTYKDYRAPGNPPAFPFTGMIEHTLWWQVILGLPLYITYNLPPGTIMRITDNITGTLLNLGPFTGQGVATIPGSYTAFATKAFLKMEYDNIVPVELTSFTALILQNEKAVELNWTTATETNNSGFEIERQVGSGQAAVGNWNSIGFVPGFGNTTEPKSYSFIDEDVTTGTYKYRLKQIDFDGSFTYSNEAEVSVDFTPKEFVLYQNYPNPFNPRTSIQYALSNRQFVSITVYDLLGREITTLVNEEKLVGEYEVDFNAANLPDGKAGLPTGIYFYQLRVGQFVETKKMILLK